MKKEMESNYFASLLKNSKTAKKQVAVYLDDATLERIDMITRLFSSISDSKSFARNTLIEDAINKYISESEEFLQTEHGIDVAALIEKTKFDKFDTLILSSNGRGFEETFLGELEDKCWYPCRVSEAREQNLKYLAIYRGLPYSAITHYVKIKDFKNSPEKGCKICYFDGDPIELPHKVLLGSKDSCFFIGAKYTTLDSLRNATKADELIFG